MRPLVRGSVTYFLLVTFSSTAAAAQLIHADVELAHDNYEVNLALILEGDFDRLKQIVTGYQDFASISPTVESSRVISGASGSEARVELVLRPCVFVIFCRNITKVSDTTIEDAGARVQFIAVPDLSDFHEAKETITLVDEPGSKTPSVRFVYSAVLQPKFFVPPFIGPWLIRRYIVNDLQNTSDKVEQMLRQEAVAGER